METNEEEFKITKHAYERAKERLGWKAKTLDRMVSRAFNSGITHGSAKGTLDSYITAIWSKKKSINNIRIFSEHLFFFKDKTLITVYRIPSKMVKHAIKQK